MSDVPVNTEVFRIDWLRGQAAPSVHHAARAPPAPRVEHGTAIARATLCPYLVLLAWATSNAAVLVAMEQCPLQSGARSCCRRRVLAPFGHVERRRLQLGFACSSMLAG